MKNTLLTACLVLACTAPLTAQESDGDWYADFDKAAAVAKEQGKDLFVDFTGSDWCHWCIKLHEEVFAHDDFLSPAQEMFVLVALDYPRSEEVKAKVPNPKRNEELRVKYSIRGYPTCLLMTPEGTVFGNMGYQPGGPEKYIEDMRSIAAKGKKLLADLKLLKTEYQDAEDKAPVVTKAITMLQEMNAESTGINIVADIVKNALTIDPANKSGLKLKALEALLSTGQADDKISGIAFQMDPKNELGLYEKVIAVKFGNVADEAGARVAVTKIEDLLKIGSYHDAVMVKSLAATAAGWSQMFKDDARAKAIATSAVTIDAEVDERMQMVLQEILDK